MKQNKGILPLMTAQLFWGLQSLYYHLFQGYDMMLVLAFRIISTALLMAAICAFRGEWPELIGIFRSPKVLKYYMPAVILLFFDWYIFVWATKNGRIIDASLGHYISPLVLFLLGVILFREKYTKAHILALGLVVIGVVISLVGYGSFPMVAILIALNWSAYSSVKKQIPVSSIVGVTAETMALLPFAIIWILWKGQDLVAACPPSMLLALCGTGVISAAALMSYTKGLRYLPLVTVCILQYISPTLSTVSGFILGETLPPMKAVSFLVILCGVVVYTISLIRKSSEKVQA